MSKLDSIENRSASELIDDKIAGLADWRGAILRTVRKLIRDADPEVLEELKWAKASNAMLGVPAWSHDGIICTGETYRDKVKLTFARGASVPDPGLLFNSSLDGNTRRAIDIHQGERLNAQAFKALVGAAVEVNIALRNRKPKRAK